MVKGNGISAKKRVFRSFFYKEFLEISLNNKKQLQKYVFCFFYFFFFLLVLLLNIKTPLIGDDFVYSFIYQTDDRLASVQDVIHSQVLHYYKWGGRSVVHFGAQMLLLNYNPILVDTLNTLVFVALLMVVYFHITRKKELNINLLLVVFALIWFFQPVFAETILWITGSANYLWGTFLILSFLLPYRFYNNKEVSLWRSSLYTVLMLGFGIIAGWTNENTAAAMIVMTLAFLYYYHCQKWDKPLWLLAGFIGALIGYGLMIVAPGNFARASEAPELSPFLIVYRTLTYTQRFIIYLGALNLGCVIAYLIYCQKSTANTSKIGGLIIIYFVGVFVSIYTMLLSPSFPARAWFGTISFNIISFGIIYNNLNMNIQIIRQVKAVIFIFCLFAVPASFYDAYKDVSRIDEIWKYRENVIAEKKQAGETKVVFQEYQARTKFGLGDTPYALPYISKYYEIDFELE